VIRFNISLFVNFCVLVILSGCGSSGGGGAEGSANGPSNTASVAADAHLDVVEDTAVQGALRATDVDGNPLHYLIVQSPSKGTVTITDAATGLYVYTPHANVTGEDRFAFQANDGMTDSNLATVLVTIVPVNDAPVASNATISVTEDTMATETFAATDVDGDTLSFSIVAQGSKGFAVITDPATGSYIYRPDANATGEDSFTFLAHDGTSESNVATVNVSITPRPSLGFTFSNTRYVSDVDNDSPEETFSDGRITVLLHAADGTIEKTVTTSFDSLHADLGAVNSDKATVTIIAPRTGYHPLGGGVILRQLQIDTLVDLPVKQHQYVLGKDVEGYLFTDLCAHEARTVNFTLADVPADAKQVTVFPGWVKAVRSTEDASVWTVSSNVFCLYDMGDDKVSFWAVAYDANNKAIAYGSLRNQSLSGKIPDLSIALTNVPVAYNWATTNGARVDYVGFNSFADHQVFNLSTYDGWSLGVPSASGSVLLTENGAEGPFSIYAGINLLDENGSRGGWITSNSLADLSTVEMAYLAFDNMIARHRSRIFSWTIDGAAEFDALHLSLRVQNNTRYGFVRWHVTLPPETRNWSGVKLPAQIEDELKDVYWSTPLLRADGYSNTATYADFVNTAISNSHAEKYQGIWLQQSF
jgi:VCBS repeat-containing protein